MLVVSVFVCSNAMGSEFQPVFVDSLYYEWDHEASSRKSEEETRLADL